MSLGQHRHHHNVHGLIHTFAASSALPHEEGIEHDLPEGDSRCFAFHGEVFDVSDTPFPQGVPLTSTKQLLA